MLPSCLPFWSICLQDLLKHVRLNRLSRTFSSLSTIRLISIQWGCSAEHGKNIIIPLEQSIVLSPWSVSASTENTAQVSPREDHLRKGHWKSMISLRVYNTPTPLTFSLSHFIWKPSTRAQSTLQESRSRLLLWSAGLNLMQTLNFPMTERYRRSHPCPNILNMWLLQLLF